MGISGLKRVVIQNRDDVGIGTPVRESTWSIYDFHRLIGTQISEGDDQITDIGVAYIQIKSCIYQ